VALGTDIEAEHNGIHRDTCFLFHLLVHLFLFLFLLLLLLFE
tara:strand:- start:96 stop:221 length:126 start_codon:yes stop_codon:yes gene_type:complete